MNFKQKLIAAILSIVALTAFAPEFLAQKTTGDRLLVDGKLPLRQSDAEQLGEFFEWLFDTQFSAAERGKFMKILVREWQTNERSPKGLTEIKTSYSRVKSLNEDTREKLRQELLAELIGPLEKSNGAFDMFLAGIYRRAQEKNVADKPQLDDSVSDDSDTPDASGGFGDLAGIWSTSSVSGERYKSLVTGELSDPNGSVMEYQFSPNGDVKLVGYLSSTVYSCTTKLFTSQTGRASVNGSTLTLNFAPGKRIYQTCSASASRNDTLPAVRKTVAFRIARTQSGLQLCLTENGKDLCYYKKGD